MIVTDKLKSCAAAKREILSGVEHPQSHYFNNRAEPAGPRTRAGLAMAGFPGSGGGLPMTAARRSDFKRRWIITGQRWSSW